MTRVRGFWASLAIVGAALALAAPASAARPRVLVVHYETDVNPATQGYLSHQLHRAQADGYSAVVIELDTPGGLTTSMSKIVDDELAERIPVIVWVGPDGATAASAGAFVAEAADVLAMAPATNLGSSTPIDSSGNNLNSDERKKAINHYAAKLRSLAQTHHRSTTFADAAVRKAKNLTADEALREHAIDLISPSLPQLLRTIDGRRTAPKGLVLHTAGAELVQVHPGFFTRLLDTILDPNLISLLFLAGIVGLGFEIFHPGVVLPGALGAVSLVAALYGFAVLPVSWAGILLLVLGVALLVIDAHVMSHGAISVAGLTSAAFGMVFLFQNAPAPYHASVPLVVAFTAVVGGFWAFAIGKSVEVRRRPAALGPTSIVGERGEVRRDGRVLVRGELWRAHGAEGLAPGDEVEVTALEEHLVLGVRRV